VAGLLAPGAAAGSIYSVGHVGRGLLGAYPATGSALCVRQTKRNAIAKNQRCSLYENAGMFMRNTTAGTRSVAFSGRIARRALRPGAYRLTVTATDAQGRIGVPRTAHFTIVR
jgi:hypothetical protein